VESSDAIQCLFTYQCLEVTLCTLLLFCVSTGGCAVIL